MKVHNFQILSEMYIIFNSYDTLHIEASNLPSDIGHYLLPAEHRRVTSKLNGMIMQTQVPLNDSSITSELSIHL